MSSRRGYQLVCPIARALDRVGDRWSLLILRDLHAGPARFGELQAGLGLATNLLSSRLRDLTDDGLIERTVDGRGYALTEAGRRTDRVLFELAQLGVSFAPGEDLREPGNLRSIVVPLRTRLREVPRTAPLVVELLVDHEVFTIDIDPSDVDMSIGPADDPDLRVRTTYDELLAVAEGRAGSSTPEVLEGGDRASEFFALLTAAFALGET